MSSEREELRRAAAELAVHDEYRGVLLRRRDWALVRARDAGVSWRDLQADSGLSVGAVRKAIRRMVE